MLKENPCFAYISDYISLCLKRKANDINNGIKYSIFVNLKFKRMLFWMKFKRTKPFLQNKENIT